MVPQYVGRLYQIYAHCLSMSSKVYANKPYRMVNLCFIVIDECFSFRFFRVKDKTITFKVNGDIMAPQDIAETAGK